MKAQGSLSSTGKEKEYNFVSSSTGGREATVQGVDSSVTLLVHRWQHPPVFSQDNRIEAPPWPSLVLAMSSWPHQRAFWHAHLGDENDCSWMHTGASVPASVSCLFIEFIYTTLLSITSTILMAHNVNCFQQLYWSEWEKTSWVQIPPRLPNTCMHS